MPKTWYKIVDGKVWSTEGPTGDNLPGGAEGAIDLPMPNGDPGPTALWSDEARAILSTPTRSAMEMMREQRNQLLKHSEEENPGSGLADRPWSNAWKTYRQALRDLPDTQTPEHDGITGKIKNVTWPTKPS